MTTGHGQEDEISDKGKMDPRAFRPCRMGIPAPSPCYASTAATRQAMRMALVKKVTDPSFPEDARFSAIVQDMANHYHVQVCALTLTTDHVVHIKAQVGITSDLDPSGLQGSRLFRHNIARDIPMVIYDALGSTTYSEDPLVTNHPHARFYAAAPLVYGPGLYVGTLAIAALEPRKPFTLMDCEALQDKAQEVVQILRELVNNRGHL
eukprot:CAMPEP_0197888420 /NCGR_PEP_ID=MMETSP1439-20131203/21980_1 /TAXON_ID=66791 /ORGANISM="Gonyaulax spinifera, Strain CCMP409" /LENGTH=206 /DNA_ID=CAMNT_0043508331 /DNA_START=110 /DNA_END=730 /DNA_ORIENTATION=+